jgi:hypothetical protein
MKNNDNDTTRARRAASALLCLAAAPLLMGGGPCEQPLVNDSGFDLWCGDQLCAWEVNAGAVARVPTWHESDSGVALLGAGATISQLLPSSSADLSCLHFDLLADLDETADVRLEVNFDDDGIIEWPVTLPSGAWTPLSYHFAAPTYFHKVRISIRKQGGGRAALAQLAAASSSDCTGAPPTGVLARPLGAACEMPEQCAAGRCLARTPAGELLPDPTAARMACAGCSDDGDCGAGTVCGLGWSPEFLEPHRACAPAAAAVLGDRCLVDAECASGACCGGVCSSCCADSAAHSCQAGATCRARAPAADGKPLRTAWQCVPGDDAGATGAPCLTDDSCSSARCVAAATLTVCGADGRRCAGNADCPGGSPGNPCIAIGEIGRAHV